MTGYGGGLTWKLSAVATLAALSNLPVEAMAELEARELEADTEVARLLLDRLSRTRRPNLPNFADFGQNFKTNFFEVFSTFLRKTFKS